MLLNAESLSGKELLFAVQVEELELLVRDL